MILTAVPILTSDHVQTAALIVALLLSVAAIAFSGQIARLDQLSRQYHEYSVLSELRVNHPEHSYLLELPGNYEGRITDFRTSPLPVTNRLEYLMRERAIAIRIFQVYEEAWYAYENRSPFWLPKRRRLSREVLAYFQSKLLKNPRLQFLWSEAGGNIRIHFADKVVEEYEKALRNPGTPAVDPQGPLPALAGETGQSPSTTQSGRLGTTLS